MIAWTPGPWELMLVAALVFIMPVFIVGAIVLGAIWLGRRIESKNKRP